MHNQNTSIIFAYNFCTKKTMLRIIGKLEGKSLIHEGVSEHGAWHIVRFFVEKTFRKKKIKIVFIAKGKLANLVFNIPLKEKIDIRFFPNCKEVNTKWYTELQAISVEKYVPLNHQYITTVNNEVKYSPNFELGNDLQLFEKTK